MSLSDFPRFFATSCASKSLSRPSNTARTTFYGCSRTYTLRDDIDVACTLQNSTHRASSNNTGAGAGWFHIYLGRLVDAGNLVGQRAVLDGHRNHGMLCSIDAFLIASVTSFALPKPNPTWPCLSPTTDSAEKENLRPPLTTLAVLFS